MESKTKILIVDDDLNICELISLYLEKEGYKTSKAHSGLKAIETINLENPDLILLDLMLPEIDGYEVCKEVRKTRDTPIIMITSRGETFDKVIGLELGADDYVVKPFDSKELVARIKAVLRRFKVKKENNGAITYGELTIDERTHVVVYHGNSIQLPLKEFELLLFFAKRPKQVFTREQLLDKIWGYDFLGDTRTVDVHIKRLREKMTEDDEWSIKTVWGVGYKFDNI